MMNTARVAAPAALLLVLGVAAARGAPQPGQVRLDDAAFALSLAVSPMPRERAQAVAVLEIAIARAPEDPLLHLALADVRLLRYAAGDTRDRSALAKAVRSLDLVIAANPAAADPYIRKAQALDLLKKPEEARGAIDAGLGKLPGSIELREAGLVRLLRTGRRGEAAAFTRLESTPLEGSGEAHRRLGRAWLFFLGLEEAERHFARAVALEDSAVARADLAQVFVARGDWQRASEQLERSLERDPAVPVLYAEMAVCRHRLGQAVEAARWQELYVQLAPADIGAVKRLALHYEESGQGTRARLAWVKYRVSVADPREKALAAARIQVLAAKGAP